MLLRASIILAIAAMLFAANQTWQASQLRQKADAFDQCSSTFSAYLEGDQIDDTITDDLRDFRVPDHWLREGG